MYFFLTFPTSLSCLLSFHTRQVRTECRYSMFRSTDAGSFYVVMCCKFFLIRFVYNEPGLLMLCVYIFYLYLDLKVTKGDSPLLTLCTVIVSIFFFFLKGDVLLIHSSSCLSKSLWMLSSCPNSGKESSLIFKSDLFSMCETTAIMYHWFSFSSFSCSHKNHLHIYKNSHRGSWRTVSWSGAKE